MSSIETFQAWGIILSLVLAAISICLTGWQPRTYSKNLRSSTHSGILNRLDGINRLLIERPEVFANLDKPYPTKRKDSNPADPRTALMGIILTLFEEAYFQHHRYGLLD